VVVAGPRTLDKKLIKDGVVLAKALFVHCRCSLLTIIVIIMTVAVTTMIIQATRGVMEYLAMVAGVLVVGRKQNKTGLSRSPSVSCHTSVIVLASTLSLLSACPI